MHEQCISKFVDYVRKERDKFIQRISLYKKANANLNLESLFLLQEKTKWCYIFKEIKI